RLPGAARSAAHAARRGAGALAGRELGPATALEPAGAADADGAVLEDRSRRAEFLDRRLGRLRAGAQAGAADRGATARAGRGRAWRRRARALRGRPEGRFR